MSRNQVRMEEVVLRLRRDILSGRFPRGSRIPTCRAMQKITGASHLTVYSALRSLQRDGFLEAKGRQGTFVHSSPPHLDDYGFLWAGYEQENWSYFFKALSAVMTEKEPFGPDKRIRFYGSPGRTTTEDAARLYADINASRLAGLIMAPSSVNFAGTPLRTMSGFPTVGIFSGQARSILHVDYASFYRQSLEYLLLRKCRRVAVLCSPLAPAPEVVTELQQSMRRLRLPFDPRLVQVVSSHSPEWTRHLLSLLLALPKGQRPDGMIIADDHCVSEVTTCLKAAGHGGMPLAALGNYPALPPAHMPVRFIGFDAREIIRAGLEIIGLQRSGQAPVSYRIPANEFHQKQTRP